jgi:hypothetical protein
MFSGLPGNRSLHFEAVFAVDIGTQCIVYCYALEVVGGFKEGVQGQLLRDGDGDGRSCYENELCHNFHGDQAGRIPFQFVSQRSVERLDTVQLD